MPTPFRIDVPQAVLDDLGERLRRTRWPSPAPYEPWVQGTSLSYLRELVTYWRDEYDWRTHEAALNQFEQLTEVIAHQKLHALHVRSPHASAMPLLLIHGWPGSVYEFHKLLPRLRQPEAYGGREEDAFHVVVPSLPGYGWSPAPVTAGMTPRAMGHLFAELMPALGYPRFGLQGGDWGSIIASWLAFDHPQAVTGLHLNMAGMRPYLGASSPPLTEAEQVFVSQAGAVRSERFAYQTIQGSRPQTLGYGLTDSPVGLAGWLIEKFQDWSDCGGDLERSFTKDELLTNIMVYWVTSSITSSTRLYYEFRKSKEGLQTEERIETPTAWADFPAEILRPPRSWVERSYNLVRHREFPSGGHFAALEEPALLSEDIVEFFAQLRG